MRIGFYAGSCLPISANSIEERPLGGTETGVIRVAEILARRKHDVVVFTSMKAPPLSIPQYVPQSYIHSSGRFDVMVLVKDWKPAVFNIASNRIFYWTGDGFDQYINFGLGDRRVVKRIEKLLSVSKWQATTMCEKSGFPIEKTFFVGNGAHLLYFEGKEERARKRLIFTAAPYRGLALMPKIFLKVRESHQDAELHVFSGMSVYDTDKPFQGPQVAEFERISSILKKIPGVVMHGNVTQKVLARELMRSSVFVYPNIIFETCCINAIEAQAAGCPVVASRNSGLVETVHNAGILIDELPGSEEYISSFVNAVSRLLENEKLWIKLSQNALHRAKTQFSWEHVADRFEAAFNQ
ncbi:MAG: glycosyltransferase family 4 protein [SAR324 cluster bacterium]|uniref:Glycosyltransferase family 4 protein n=1 Tax=SAR324 cluster bacterium TaxID=2024889 RepID=A0A7X9IJ70_9DELT|nr:glycosyltransferase family 4 protein [SAR324 cluster bacterium]